MSGRGSSAEIGVALLAAALAFLGSLTAVDDLDVYWHLAAGKLVLQSGLPTLNTFSFTHPAHPWTETEWIFDGGLALLHRAGGFAALSFGTAAVMALTVVAALSAARKIGGPLSLLHLLPVSMFVVFARFRATPRPHLVTFLCLALLLNLWCRRRERWTRPAALVLALLWVNTHAGVVFGTALLLLLVAGELSVSLTQGSAAELRQVRDGGLLALWFLPATFVNPGFAFPYTYALRHLWVKDLLPVEEFMRPGFSGHEVFFVFAGGLVLLIPLLPRGDRFQAAAAALPFFVLSLSASRVIPKFGVVALPFFLAAIPRLGQGQWRFSRPAAGVLLLLLLAPTLYYGARDYRTWPPSFGLDDRGVPVGAAAFIREAGLKGDLYNDFDDGGYLIFALYPGRRVFQDGRIPYYPESFWREVGQAANPRSWEALLDRYGATGALIKRRDDGVDFSHFIDASRWSLVFIDGNSCLYLRELPENREIIARYRFAVVRPRMNLDQIKAAVRDAPADLLREIGRIDPRRLFNADEAALYAYGLVALRQFAAADALIAEVAQHASPAWSLEYVRGLSALGRGDRGQARSRLESVVGSSPDPSLQQAARDALLLVR